MICFQSIHNSSSLFCSSCCKNYHGLYPPSGCTFLLLFSVTCLGDFWQNWIERGLRWNDGPIGVSNVPTRHWSKTSVMRMARHLLNQRSSLSEDKDDLGSVCTDGNDKAFKKKKSKRSENWGNVQTEIVPLWCLAGQIREVIICLCARQILGPWSGHFPCTAPILMLLSCSMEKCIEAQGC